MRTIYKSHFRGLKAYKCDMKQVLMISFWAAGLLQENGLSSNGCIKWNVLEENMQRQHFMEKILPRYHIFCEESSHLSIEELIFLCRFTAFFQFYSCNQQMWHQGNVGYTKGDLCNIVPLVRVQPNELGKMIILPKKPS